MSGEDPERFSDFSPPPLCGAALAPSPNHGPRRGAAAPSLILLHYTGMPSVEGALARLRDAEAGVSAHYLIDPGGALSALAPESRRAWHAGVASWAGEEDVNSRALGVELAHPGHDAAGACPPFPEAQMRALEALLAALMVRWSIPPERVLAHSDVAPGRKIDPGERFDWLRLARAGLARETPVAPPAPEHGGPDAPARFEAALRRIGYGPWPFPALLDAFRRRWRPGALGRALEPEDVALAQALAPPQSGDR